MFNRLVSSFVTAVKNRWSFSYENRVRLLLLPYGVGVLLLVGMPAFLTLLLPFFQIDGLSPPIFAGSLNFLLAISDELFLLSLQNGLALVLLPMPLRLGVAFGLALLLRRDGRGVSLFRAAAFLPSIIPTTAFALAWLWLLNPLFGPINWLLRELGLLAPGWFADPLWAKPGLVLFSLWQVGEGFLVLLAALHDLPQEMEEAAWVDGAGIFARFRYLTLPLLAPILLLLAMRDVILTFQQSFEAILVTTGGGPYYASYTLPLFVYEQGFGLGAFGVAGVGLWGLYLVTTLLLLVLWLMARQWGVVLSDDALLI